MYFSYIWHTSGMSLSEAYQEFSRILNNQRELYSDAWGVDVGLRIFQEGQVVVGQIQSDPGITGWQSWTEEDSALILWNGICESYLGCDFSSKDIREILTTLSDTPEELCSWDGRFFIVSWDPDRDKMLLTTAATECPTLWHTEGPRGWAAGSRGAPILEMVRRNKRPCLGALNLYLAFGYLYSDQSLFEHVHRISSRTQVIIGRNEKPKLRTYATIEEYLKPSECPNTRDGVLQIAADRIVRRVAKQIKYSSKPRILLTGGRDSRCIAAAAKRSGYSGTASTGGEYNSRDVIIAAQVADRLDFKHIHSGDRVTIDQLKDSIDRLILLIRMSEGMEVVRHARAYKHFLECNMSDSSEKPQRIHGLGGEIGRGYYYKKGWHNQIRTHDISQGPRILLQSIPDCMQLHTDARELLDERFDGFNKDVQNIDLSVAQWLDLFFFHNSCLRWGADMLSVKSPMGWTWTPLLDRDLIRAYWTLTPEYKSSDRFYEELALTLEPLLADIEYDHATLPETKVLDVRRVKSLLGGFLRNVWITSRFFPKRKETMSPNKSLTQLWEMVLFDKNEHILAEIIDRETLRIQTNINPNSEVLWNAATMQLFVTAHF